MNPVVVRLLAPLPALVLAPLLLGLIGRVKAIMGARRGAPLLQPYRDLARLLGKGELLSTTATPLFRLGPVAALASTAAALLLLPAGPLPPALSFPGDLLLLAYLLALGRFGTLVAAMDTGSAFEGMGASREAAFSALSEPALFLALGGLAWARHGLSLGALLGGGTAAGLARQAPALGLFTAALFLLLLAENSRIPVDDPATHLELTMIHEVMVLDHSGPTFAAILYGASLKLWIFASLLVSVWIPAGLPAWASAGLYAAGMALVTVSVGLVESLTARLKLAKVPRFLALAGVLASLGCLVLFAGGRP